MYVYVVVCAILIESKNLQLCFFIREGGKIFSSFSIFLKQKRSLKSLGRDNIAEQQSENLVFCRGQFFFISQMKET